MNAPELHSWLRSRRSVRRFKPDAIPADAIARILETATWAPNAHNRQPWRFVQLASLESRAQLVGAMGTEFGRALRAEGLSNADVEKQILRSRARLFEAPEAILLCLDTSILDKYENAARTEGEHMMGVQSVALAGGQLLLAAHAEGVSGVWMCAPLFVPAEVQSALKLPESWRAQGVILLGYAAGDAVSKERVDLNAVKRVI